MTTGVRDAEAAAWQVLSRPNTRAQWVVVKMGGAGALLASRNNKSTQHAKAIQVLPAERNRMLHRRILSSGYTL